MADQKTTVQDLKNDMAQFVKEREWEQFHSPKNLSMNIAAEAAELMEKFLWCESQDSFKELQENRSEIEDELADTLIALIAFANAAGIDLSKSFEKKLAEVAAKYPIEKSKGRSTKYTKL